MKACQWDPRDRIDAVWHAGKSIGQCNWSCRQHNKLSQDSKEMCSLFVSVIKTVYQGNIPFVKTIHIMYVLIKGIIRKMNCYWCVRFFFVCIKLVNIKTKKIWAGISTTHKKRGEKTFKNMDSSKKTTVKLSRKTDLRGVYTEEYFWRLMLPLIHTLY